MSQDYCIFDQMNAALVTLRDFFQKHKTIFFNTRLLNSTEYTVYKWFLLCLANLFSWNKYVFPHQFAE